MRIIGYKKQGIAAMYIVTSIVSIFIMFMGLSMLVKFGKRIPGVMAFTVLFVIIGLIILGISLYTIITYIKTPNEAIKVIDEKEIQILNSINIDIRDVIDVSYKKASAKGIQYKWGDIIIKTTNNSYKIRYIAECEDVSKELTRLMYTYKNNSEF